MNSQKFENPYVAASHGTVDNVINPAETRPMLIKALRCLQTREKQLLENMEISICD